MFIFTVFFFLCHFFLDRIPMYVLDVNRVKLVFIVAVVRWMFPVGRFCEGFLSRKRRRYPKGKEKGRTDELFWQTLFFVVGKLNSY